MSDYFSRLYSRLKQVSPLFEGEMALGCDKRNHNLVEASGRSAYGCAAREAQTSSTSLRAKTR